MNWICFVLLLKLLYYTMNMWRVGEQLKKFRNFKATCGMRHAGSGEMVVLTGAHAQLFVLAGAFCVPYV